MKKFLKLFVVFLILSVSSPLVQPVFGQLKADAVKSSSKMSLWFGKVKAKCETSMAWVANSQVGQFVGDGIKYAKQGIAFAKKQYEAAMELYEVASDAVLNSKEYKAAMISKDIATETMKLKKIQEEQLQKLEEIKQQQELIKQQAEGKIAAVRANIDLNEQRMLAEEADAGGISDNAQNFMQDNEKAIAEIQKETALQIATLGEDSLMFLDETKERLLDQGEKVAELVTKLNEVMSDGKGKKETRPAKELIQEQQDTFLLKAGEVSSLKVDAKKKKAQKKALFKSSESGLKIALGDTKAKKTSLTDKVESKSGTSATMTGESEVSGVNTEVLSEQLNIILKYIRLNLAHLKMQAVVELNKQRSLDSIPVQEKFMLCQYTNPKNKVSAVEKARQDAESMVDKVGEKVQQGKDLYEKGQAAAAEAQQVVKDGKEAAGALGDAAGGAVNDSIGDMI